LYRQQFLLRRSLSMKLLRRIPALLLTLILALGVGISPVPSALLAAPVAQETEDPAVTAYYESDVLESADSSGLVVGLILYEDGSAEVISDYMNDEDVIVEVGTWVDNGNETLTLTVTGTVDGDYEAPIDLVFNIDEDGALVIPGATGGAFGEEGLSLFPAELSTEAEPGAEPGAEVDAEPETEAVSSSDAILAEIPEGALVYQSEVMTAASSPGLQITLVVFDDNTVAMVSDSMNGEDVVVEVGTWAEADDGSIALTLTGPAEGEAYPEPVALTFTSDAEGALILADEEGVLFGDAGLTLLPIDVDAAADITPSGAYISDVIPAEDGTSTFLVGLFHDDGTLLISTYSLAGDLPVLEVGTWEDNGDGTYTVLASGTISGTVEESYDEPIEIDFSVEEDGTLLLSGTPLYAVEDLDLGSEEISLVAEFQSDLITTTSDVTHTMTLSLYGDFSAELYTEYPEEDDSLTEYGEWDISEENQLLLTITGDDETEYDEPVEWIFDIAEDDTLSLANDDEGFYGDEGLTLLPVEIDAALTEEEAATDGEATTEATAEPTVEVPEEATAEPTAEPTDEESDAIASLALENAQLFQSEVLPAATGAGLQLTLALLDDATAAMEYDYLDGEEVATDLGNWVDNGDGTFTVTFTEGPTGELEAPIELTLELGDDGNLTITDATEESVALLDVVLAPFVLE
jgi:hypothetical protein